MTSLKLLGFDATFYASVLSTLESDRVLARVTEQQKGLFKVTGESQEWWAEPSGRLMFEARGAEDLPVVGDWVQVSVGGPNDRLQILAILPRKTLIARRAISQDHEAQLLAANVDHIFVVSSLNYDLNPKRLDRYRALVRQAGAAGTLLLTKSDLIAEDAIPPLMASVAHSFPVLVVSGISGQGMEALREKLPSGSTAVFIGSSGVGKSTLLNALLGEERQDTAGIRESDSRGRHTTSSRSLIALPSGALLIDTPGIRELGLWNLDEETLQESFDELEGWGGRCRYRDCQHESEPGCAVQEAIQKGQLNAERLASYRKLQKEQAFYERRQDKVKMIEEKNRWKSIHKAMRRDRKNREN
ncbi:MAG TPA: ribosome small subunit-dependent GTPase A [Oligoflexus sp.]|uniref:ribosome small subunit-dependent GTPase A n=1 Tax=Oligoflexus sp. TaxID=1971216 RepID=UPI002D3E0ECC|nr:ribosome small subunit-dependent GTPase A [Oligoflexus sp.]HYX31765.1 ribosome small subunit-dependent GTPase A [Oligoflexus sp.]